MILREKDRLLFLSAHLPSPEGREAGQKTAFRHLSWLAEHYRITLVAFRKTVDRKLDLAPLAGLCERTVIIDVNHATRLWGVLTRPDLPLVVAARWSKGVGRLLRRLLTSQTFHRVHCEWGQMAVYAPFFSEIRVKTLYVHDVLYQWCTRRAAAAPLFAQAIWMHEVQRVKRWERRAYNPFSCVYVPSLKDKDLLVSCGKRPASRIAVLMPQIGRFGTPDRRPPNSTPRVLFWGALRRKENSAGAAWLLERVLPLVRREVPAVELLIVGSDPPPWLRRRAAHHRGVALTGYVADPEPFFASAALAALPVFAGAGVKVKVLECLAAGLPVVTTPVGAEGIEASPEEGLIVADPEPGAFAAAIVGLLREETRLRGLGERARKWAEMRLIEDARALVEGCGFASG